MFEKSLYDLIKGLRNHKGAEEDYIQNSLRECKAEIKSQDMDKKTTALLKIIYLEMFGYDMSWASFHVLEVMSSAKYLQKRVGYLGAAQSFGAETEVLMLATNLLKKDLSSSNIPNMSLPMVTLPHIVNSSLSMTLLPDIFSRLSHPHVIVRKKAVVCLYRISLVYPEALKLAWPRIKERLMDDQEDVSVTTAVINVVCELGWRRPHDFLPLAPRLFELLVDGGNNWMAIKIIKLFATLTPLEPRLIRKLSRPLTNVIQTTTAMSLLYECINGIVQGGILDSDENLWEKDEIASLCVGKLRGMIVADADPNLKYVALLAFNRIVASHPALVSMQQDVILDCLEDADVSIRLQALELTTGMVTSDTLRSVVSRLMKQLSNASLALSEDPSKETKAFAHEKNELPEQQGTGGKPLDLPPQYKMEVIHRIVDMCSCNNYLDMPDFEWYIEVLVTLEKHLPLKHLSGLHRTVASTIADIASRLGSEIRNIAVRVRNVRKEATRAAEALILTHTGPGFFSKKAPGDGILSSLAWVVGEYAEHLSFPEQTLQSLVDASNTILPARALSIYLQAIPKVLVCLTSNGQPWDKSRKSGVSLLLARVLEFLEALASHPDLDVQERAIEYLEVLRLAMEAVHTETHPSQETPFILSTVVPGLFSGLELNPVAPGAQKRVPLPETLTLDQPLEETIFGLFDDISDFPVGLEARRFSQGFYYAKDTSMLDENNTETVHTEVPLDTSYQDITDASLGNTVSKTKREAERRDRNKDDPFYIDTGEKSSGTSTPFHKVFNSSNGDGLDVDTIPIIDLQMTDGLDSMASLKNSKERKRPGSGSKKYEITVDETFGHEDSAYAECLDEPSKIGPSLLGVDTSGLGYFSLEEHKPDSNSSRGNVRKDEDEAEMVKAMQDVEKVRLEMQRATERIHPKDVPAEGMLVKKKKKKVHKPQLSSSENQVLQGKDSIGPPTKGTRK